MSIQDTVAAIISQARTDADMTAPEFDYMIKVEGIGGPMGYLGQAAYTVVTQTMTGLSTSEREAVVAAVWQDIRPELDAYAARCAAREFTGWSTAAKNLGHKIRYAN